MDEVKSMKNKRTGATNPLVLDAAVIGAGVAGLYQLHQLREQGLNVRAFDAASGVGGTWYWNRYPGAKFDSGSYVYQYLFSEELYKGWSWTEKFPEQPEIERWMNYVADTLDLRGEIQLNTTIEAAHYDEDRGRWTLTTDSDEVIDAQFVIACSGMLSAPMSDLFQGQDSFKGQIFHTARWPKHHVELKGKRVAVIGNGATGIQVIQTIAPEVSELKVFIRTPQYVNAMNNPKYGPAEVAEYKSKFKYFQERLPNTFGGFEFSFDNGTWAEKTPEQRQEVLERIWKNGSLELWTASFSELFFEEEVNEQISEFVRNKMRERLKDPELCDLLIPTDYGFGTHRVPLESGYLEAYHLPHVSIVSVKDNPISKITQGGIELADGTEHQFDVIIMATGFDAGTGALTRIDIRGRDGRSLKEQWREDITTTMGLQISGYPNLFTTGAPLAPSAALCNMTTCLSQQTEWISGCIQHLRDNDLHVIEPTLETEQQWVKHHDELANETLVTKTNSWYMGSNIEGKPRRLLSYVGGVDVYKDKCIEVASQDYKGFEMR